MNASVDRLLQQAVEAGDVRGVAVAAGTRDGVLCTAAAGTRDADGKAPMAPETVVWIASMTKAVTTVAALQMVEQGKLAMDAPLGETVPQLASPQVLEGFDEAGEPRLRAARRPITLRQLLTHTSGCTYDMWNADMARYMVHAGVPRISSCQNAALTTPLIADPGERWEYGIGIDWAGKAVEAVSGQKLDAYLQDHVLGPLGMRDTAFRIGESQRARLVAMHARRPDGGLQPIPFEVPQNPEFHTGGGGLYGTAPDYLRFCRMILGKGRLDGVQVLRSETVAEMERDQITPLRVLPMRSVMPQVTNDTEFFPGRDKGWTLGFMRNTEAVPGRRSAGSLAWAGLANTYYWIDPTRGVAGVLVTQILPFADPRVLALLERFEAAVYAGLDVPAAA
ncbi:MAG: beta-lactamase family protein [Acetobacteraceae bacterium]|nr:beta-lactamase family protein [Acetobacteraceae bacterium]